MIIGCTRPPEATVGEVLTELDKPRNDGQLQVLRNSGQKLFKKNNCHICHVVEGPPSSAPALQHIVGRKVTLRSGVQVTRDRDYLVRSVIHPAQQVVPGYPQPMSNYRFLKADEIAAIVLYLESLSPSATLADSP